MMPMTIEQRVDILLREGVDRPKKWATVHGYNDPTVILDRHPIEPSASDAEWESRRCLRCGELVSSVRSSEFGTVESGWWAGYQKRGPVGQCKMRPVEDWEDEWKRLREHHLAETNFLFDVIKELTKRCNDRTSKIDSLKSALKDLLSSCP